MRIFGICLSAKREPKWASHIDVQRLSELCQAIIDDIATINRRLEAHNRKIYRDDSKAKDITDDVDLKKLVPEPALDLGPGAVLTPEQLNRLSGAT